MSSTGRVQYLLIYGILVFDIVILFPAAGSSAVRSSTADTVTAFCFSSGSADLLSNRSGVLIDLKHANYEKIQQGRPSSLVSKPVHNDHKLYSASNHLRHIHGIDWSISRRTARCVLIASCLFQFVVFRCRVEARIQVLKRPGGPCWHFDLWSVTSQTKNTIKINFFRMFML